MQLIAYVLTWMLVRIRSERGQDLIEYAMLGGLIALAIIAVVALGAFETPLKDMAKGIGDCVDFKSTTECKPF
jgi:Flp pilus assembly pilin Flp